MRRKITAGLILRKDGRYQRNELIGDKRRTFTAKDPAKVWADIQNAVDGPTYRENLEADPEAKLSKETLDEIFDPWDFLTRKDVVFDRLKELEF